MLGWQAKSTHAHPEPNEVNICIVLCNYSELIHYICVLKAMCVMWVDLGHDLQDPYVIY